MAETAASPTAADKNLAARVSPARQLAEAFAAGSLAGTVELKELPFLTMVGLRAQAGSDTAQRLAAVTGGLPAGVGAKGNVPTISG